MHMHNLNARDWIPHEDVANYFNMCVCNFCLDNDAVSLLQKAQLCTG